MTQHLNFLSNIIYQQYIIIIIAKQNGTNEDNYLDFTFFVVKEMEQNLND